MTEGSKYALDNVSQFGHGTQGYAFRGRLTSGGTEPQDVVCKIAYEEDLRSHIQMEAKLLFGKLAHLQGKYVPRYLGLFQAQFGLGQELVCLVVTFEGDVLLRKLMRYPFEFRTQAIDALVALHRAGVCPGDVRKSFFAMREADGAAIVVFFGLCQVDGEHDCLMPLDTKIEFYAPAPKGIGCTSLHFAAHTIDVWSPATFNLCGHRNLEVKLLYTATPEDMEDLVRSGMDRWRSEAFARKELDAVLADIRDWWTTRKMYDGHSCPDP